MSDYDFFLNAEQTAKPSPFSGPSGQPPSLLKRLGIVFGGIFFLIILIWFVFGVLLKPDTSQVDGLVDLSLEQRDIIALSQEAKTNIRSSDSVELAAGARTLVTSDKAKIDSLLADAGREIGEDEFAGSTDSDIRAELDAAKSANRYDSTFVELYTDKLLGYRGQIAEAYRATDSAEQQAILNQAYANVSILLGLDVVDQES